MTSARPTEENAPRPDVLCLGRRPPVASGAGFARARLGSAGRRGFTLIEVLVVMIMLSVLTGVASQGYGQYLDRSVPERAADVVGGYITQTRAHAVQQRRPVSLAIDASDRSLMIRSATDTLQTVGLGEGSDFALSGLTSNFAGDSITFDGRGLCSVCGVAGTVITVSARGTSYEISIAALGRWKTTAKE